MLKSSYELPGIGANSPKDVLPSPSSNTSGSEISSQVNDNAATQNGFLAGQSTTQVMDASQQNNVNITQTHDVAASDDTDKRPS